MAIGSFVEDIIGNVSDADIRALNNVGEYSVTNEQYIVITHDAIGLEVMPIINIGGSPVTVGEIGSNADYIIHRVSAQQTVLKRKDFTAAIDISTEILTYLTVYHEGGYQPIGLASIGSNFVIQ
jgi:hypothetical protein